MSNFLHYIDKFSSAAFFSTAFFGITALIMVSFSWVLVGVIAGNAPKKGYSMTTVYFTGSIISLLFTGAGCLVSGIGESEAVPLFWNAAAFFVSGAICFFKGIMMSKVMQSGPNGIIWAIVQSSMVFPFVFGVTFYNVKLNAVRIAGICLMLAAFAMFACSKDNSKKGTGNWLLWAFVCLLLGGIDQTMTSLPFYYPQTRGISSTFNNFCLMSGYFVSTAVVICLNKEQIKKLKFSVSRSDFWWSSLALLPLSGLFVVLFHFPGMRAMADNGLGAMSFPILVGSCIVAFTLYSALILKEKFRLLDFTALASCVAGQILICL